MKRLIVFILIVLLLCFTNLSLTKDFNIDKIFPNSIVEIFFDEKSDFNLEKTSNGVGEIVFCDINKLSSILKLNHNISGVTFRIKNENVENILKKINVRNTYNKNFGIYGWSNVLDSMLIVKTNSLKLFDSYVNFQCVDNGDEIILGCPIILGSY